MLGLGTSVVPDSSATSFFLEASLLAKFKTRVIDDGGSVESYSCMEQQLVPLLLEPTTFTTGLLEFYPNAAAAYSLRQLRRSVSPYAIRVRRSGDSLEQDIGFNSNGELDTNALLDFANGGDAWVDTWYDQSSNGNDAVQNSVTQQPQIVSSGSLITENGKPALQFDGVNDYFTKAFTLTNPVSHFVVAKANNASEFILDGYDSNNRNSLYLDTTNSVRLYNNGAIYQTYTHGTQAVFSSISNVASSSLAVNGSNTTGSLGTPPYDMDGVTIGVVGTLGTGYCLDGTIQEVILYNSDEASNRTGIESNINDFYSIYS